MKKILILLSAIVFILLIIGAYYFFFLNPEKMRKTVLTSLEKEYEFCKIIKDEIFLNSGKFWMICNGRPFYARYENGNVIYKLNGWDYWIKKDISNDLNNCGFYKSEQLNGNYNLIFYCPIDLNSSYITAKIYSFDPTSMKMNKIQNKDFLTILSDDIKSVYKFLSTCSVENFVSKKFPGYPAIMGLTFDCLNETYFVITDLSISPLMPPILVNNDLDMEKKAKISFEKSFDCLVDNINYFDSVVEVTSICKGMRLTGYYAYEELPYVNFLIECPENRIQECANKFSNYFILPPIGNKNLKLVEEIKIPECQVCSYDEKNATQKTFIFLFGERVMSLIFAKETIYFFGVKNENIWST